MRFKGGLVNGTLASLYGAASFICLFFGHADHHAMETTCYTLGGAGVLLALYWLATKEIAAIPILLIGLVHFGLAARAEHEAMNIGCTGLAVATLVAGMLMLTREGSTAAA